jgi:serine/threonine protein kinase
LYEMLTGRAPFSGAYPEAVFHAIKNEALPPFVADRAIPPAVEALVLRVLDKDPERRYQSARELARDLRLLQNLTVPPDLRPPPLTWPQRVRRRVMPARAIALLRRILEGS